jgi:UDP-N-acetyl-D-glucosamine/UDP-N-acetyl-D-galactosamine dehydrogenase
VILSGRRINDGMGRFVAQKTLKLLATAGCHSVTPRVGVLGITFKENVPDLRNSQVANLIAELKSFGVEPLVHDPLADAKAADAEYGLHLSSLDVFAELDALVVAVPHAQYRLMRETFLKMLRSRGVFVDVTGIFEADEIPLGLTYWTL